MKELIKITSLAALFMLTFTEAESAEFTLGVQLGICDAEGWITMCEERLPTVHLYADITKKVYKSLSVVLSYEHYSSFDGKADLNGDTPNQTGKFDFIGAGVEYTF